MATSVSDFIFLSEVVPSNLPPPEQIVAFCKEAGYNKPGIAFSDPSSGAALAWFKYGPDVTMDEAFTQAWVAEHLNAQPEAGVKAPRVYMAFTSPHPACTVGYIVMEHIAAPDCTNRDYKRVAQAVNTLIRVQAPSSVPGHYGGGAVVHNFFVEWESGIKYKTSKELQDHVNGILKLNEDTRRVNFEAESLYLCPVDINPGNFKMLEDKIVALDFHATCFLPESFIAYAMQEPAHDFARKVAKYVKYPQSSNFRAMEAASAYLACYGTNSIALPTSIRRRLGR